MLAKNSLNDIHWGYDFGPRLEDVEIACETRKVQEGDLWAYCLEEVTCEACKDTDLFRRMES